MSTTRQHTADAIERVALTGALLLLAIFGMNGNYEAPDPLHFGALVAVGIGLVAVFTRKSWAGGFAFIAVLAVSLRDRMLEPQHYGGSDVLDATNEAIGVLFRGQNPYAHFYSSTRPPGSPFAYPPGELGFYSIAHLVNNNILRIDLACGLLILGIVAALVPFCGTGLTTLAMSIIGWAPFLTLHTTDGSNDNAAAFLLLAGLASLMWSRTTPGRAGQATWWLSAILLGWALAFKEYTAPLVLFVALFLWRENAARARGWIAAVLGTVAAFVLPFLIWNAPAFVQNVGGAVITHRAIWGRNVWHDVVSAIPFGTAVAPAIPALTIVGVLVAAVVLWRSPARSLPDALLQGIAVVSVMFFLARWTTSVYYAFLAPVLVSAVVLRFGHEYELGDRHDLQETPASRAPA